MPNPTGLWKCRMLRSGIGGSGNCGNSSAHTQRRITMPTRARQQPSKIVNSTQHIQRPMSHLARTGIYSTGRSSGSGRGGYYNGINYFMRSPVRLNPVPPGADFVSDAERAAGTQAFRHPGGTNVVYCDGHAATQFHRFTVTQPTAVPVGAGTGFLSADNSAYQTNRP